MHTSFRRPVGTAKLACVYPRRESFHANDVLQSAFSRPGADVSHARVCGGAAGFTGVGRQRLASGRAGLRSSAVSGSAAKSISPDRELRKVLCGRRLVHRLIR